MADKDTEKYCWNEKNAEKYWKDREKAHEFLVNHFNFIDSTLFIWDYPEAWHDHWTFMAVDDEVGDEDLLVDCYVPMWSTWYEVSTPYLLDQVGKLEKDVANLGFTLIYHNGDLWGLGIDSAGHDFYEAYWIPLHKLLCPWEHGEEEEE